MPHKKSKYIRHTVPVFQLQNHFDRMPAAVRAANYLRPQYATHHNGLCSDSCTVSPSATAASASLSLAIPGAMRNTIEHLKKLVRAHQYHFSS